MSEEEKKSLRIAKFVKIALNGAMIGFGLFVFLGFTDPILISRLSAQQMEGLLLMFVGSYGITAPITIIDLFQKRKKEKSKLVR